MIVVDRKTKEEFVYKPSWFVNFLYNNLVGRIILKLLSTRVIAKLGGLFMNSRLSKFMIKRTIINYDMNMNLYEEKNYISYNDFFTRRLKDIVYDKKKTSFISPCDSKLLALKLDKDTSFNVKGSIYNAYEIIDNEIINVYYGGYALIFRLEVCDYHRYGYIDSGNREKYNYIKGKLHTVQPIVYGKVNVFHQNSREWCVLHTENFGDIIQCEVGAMMVGKIKNNHDLIEFKKGEEKGYFEFGGSTIILFLKNNVVDIDLDILENSKLGKETIVHYGERIGIKK